MRFFDLVIAFAMMSLALAAPVPIPEPQANETALDERGCTSALCRDYKRED